jgi:hypothetical protein
MTNQNDWTFVVADRINKTFVKKLPIAIRKQVRVCNLALDAIAVEAPHVVSMIAWSAARTADADVVMVPLTRKCLA